MIAPAHLSQVPRFSLTPEMSNAVDVVTSKLNDQIAEQKKKAGSIIYAVANFDDVAVNRFEAAIRVAQAFHDDGWEVGIVELSGTEVAFPFPSRTLRDLDRGYGFLPKEIRVYEPVQHRYQSAPKNRASDILER